MFIETAIAIGIEIGERFDDDPDPDPDFDFDFEGIDGAALQEFDALAKVLAPSRDL